MRSAIRLALHTSSALAAIAALAAGCKSSDDSSAGETGGTAGATGGTIDTRTREYPATDERIRYTGRIDFSNPEAPMFSSPGVYEEARFRGDGVTVLLKDAHLNGNHNYYDVVIDDLDPILLVPERRVSEYPIDVDLEPGEHRVTVIKRTEAMIGRGSFLGFRVAGKLLDHGITRSRKLVVIGDSITAGSGVDARNGSADCSEDGWGQPYHNANHSYATVAARALDADVHVTAVSGIGLTQNYDTRWDARTMPEVYDLVYLERTDSAAWDTSRFVPDAIVLALGTNDFSPGHPDNPTDEPSLVGAGGAGGAGGAPSVAPDPDYHRPTPTPVAFAEAYIEFIETLRGYYGDVPVFCVHSPMLGNGWPNPDDTFRDDHIAAIRRVVNHYADAGDDTVYEVPTAQVTGGGCGTHPDASQHEAMADDLVDVLGPALGWD